MQSRQDGVPLLSLFIDDAKCESLHLKNNVCKGLFVQVWTVLYVCNSFNGCKSYEDIPSNNIVYKFVSFQQTEMIPNVVATKSIS